MMHPDVLILGFGNPGRRDDGLGPAAAAQLEEAGLGVEVVRSMQLGPEDAALVAGHRRTIFVDAGQGVEEPFAIRQVEPALAVTFTTHALRPETVLALSSEAFGKAPPAWHMAICGYDFELGDMMTARASRNRDAAVNYIRFLIGQWEAQDASE